MRLEWREVPVYEGGVPIRTSMTTGEAAKLRELAKDGVVLEIGSAYGYSACLMALVAQHVTSIDPHTYLDSAASMEQHLKDYGVRAKVRMLRLRSQDALPFLIDQDPAKPMFDGVFIDGDHSAAGVTHDFKLCLQMVHRGGWIACHDYGEDTCPDVRVALPVPKVLVDTLAVYRRK